MKRTTVFFAALIGGCGGPKTDAISCDAVASRLVQLELGNKAGFLTETERVSRARRWLGKCEPMSETARKCVLAATTIEEASACGDKGSATTAKAEPPAKAAWVVRGGDASYQSVTRVVLASDGDVIVAGDFDGTLDLNGHTVSAQRTGAWVARLSETGVVRWVQKVGGNGRDYVNGLGVGADGAIVITVSATDESSQFLRATVTTDGVATMKPLAAEARPGAAGLHANGDVVAISRVLEPVKKGTCAATGFVVQRFAPDGKRVWSRCNDGKEEVVFADQPMQLAAGQNGATAVCAGFHGALAWGGKAAPEGDSKRAFVMTFDAKGEVRWVTYVAGDSSAMCDAITVTEDGGVFAILLRAGPGFALASWSDDGAERWTRSCAELLDVKGKCDLTAITANGPDVVVAATLDRHTVIATIDGKTGVKKRARRFDGVTTTSSLAARDELVVFATGFSGYANFGTALTSADDSEGDASMDVLVGRL